MPFEDIQDHAGFVVKRRGEPPTDKLYMMPFEGVHFCVELGDVFRPIVVGKFTESEPNEHLGALARTARAIVERHDTPRDQVFAAK